MITFKKLGHYGRMGNQLFQYAALKCLSLRKNYPLVLPYTQNNKLTNFKVRCYFVNPVEVEQPLKIFKETQFHFDKDFFKCTDQTDFEGYYQTEKYFKDISYIIKREFQISDPHKEKACQNTIKRIRDKHPLQKITAFHIRRGDNVPSPVNGASPSGEQFKTNKGDYHPLLSEEYIDYALNKFSDDIKLVFSDSKEDIDWCKENLDGSDLYFIGSDDIFDFRLMQLCDNNVISNSSFSWWAAWLNDNKDKEILAPARWFGKELKHHNLCDLIPNEWESY